MNLSECRPQLLRSETQEATQRGAMGELSEESLDLAMTVIFDCGDRISRNLQTKVSSERVNRRVLVKFCRHGLTKDSLYGLVQSDPIIYLKSLNFLIATPCDDRSVRFQ